MYPVRARMEDPRHRNSPSVLYVVPAPNLMPPPLPKNTKNNNSNDNPQVSPSVNQESYDGSKDSQYHRNKLRPNSPKRPFRKRPQRPYRFHRNRRPNSNRNPKPLRDYSESGEDDSGTHNNDDQDHEEEEEEEESGPRDNQENIPYHDEEDSEHNDQEDDPYHNQEENDKYDNQENAPYHNQENSKYHNPESGPYHSEEREPYSSDEEKNENEQEEVRGGHSILASSVTFEEPQPNSFQIPGPPTNMEYPPDSSYSSAGSDPSSPSNLTSIYADDNAFQPVFYPIVNGSQTNQVHNDENRKETAASNVGFTDVVNIAMPNFDSFGNFGPPVFN